MTDKNLDAAWRSYVERVMPASAPIIQHQECRRAFYAGAAALLGGIMKSLDPGLDPTDDDLAIMDGIQIELDQFDAAVRAGRA